MKPSVQLLDEIVERIRRAADPLRTDGSIARIDPFLHARRKILPATSRRQDQRQTNGHQAGGHPQRHLWRVLVRVKMKQPHADQRADNAG